MKIKIGLFGIDLSDFILACKEASNICYFYYYEDFDGWAIGTEFVIY